MTSKLAADITGRARNHDSHAVLIRAGNSFASLGWRYKTRWMTPSHTYIEQVKPLRNRLPPLLINPRHRVQPAAMIVDILVLAGWAFEVAAGGREAALAATRTALDRWVAIGLGFAPGPGGKRLFDPVEVVNFVKSSGFAGDDPFWETRFVRTGRALVTSLAAEGEVLAPATDRSRRIAMRLERTFDLSQVEPGRKLRLKMPLPLAGPYVAEPVVDPDPVEAADARVTVLAGRMEVVLPAAAGLQTLTLGANVSFTALHPGDMPIESEAPAEHYLSPREGFVSVTDRVRGEALALADPSDRLRTVMNFWSYLIDTFACGPAHYDAIGGSDPMDWLLDHRWYDCQLGAALLVSMCRAVQIPARLVGGHVLYRLAPTNHFWAEIWFPERGWLPFDLQAWDLSLGGVDRLWRNSMAGTCDHRMMTQCFPTQFVGPMSIKAPALQQLHQTTGDGWLNIALYDVARGHRAYSDKIQFL